MKNRFFLLSSVISSCIIGIVSTQAVADQRHPDMPSGKHRCYPGSKCTGDPNLIHKDGDRSEYPGNMHGNKNGNNGEAPAKVLKTESVERFEGTIQNVQRVRLPKETQIQIEIQTSDGVKQVIVGPARFVDKSMVKLQTGDKVQVVGYLIRANGDEVIMAAQIKKNGNVLQLLNDKRQPLWNNQ